MHSLFLRTPSWKQFCLEIIRLSMICEHLFSHKTLAYPIYAQSYYDTPTTYKRHLKVDLIHVNNQIKNPNSCLRPERNWLLIKYSKHVFFDCKQRNCMRVIYWYSKYIYILVQHLQFLYCYIILYFVSGKFEPHDLSLFCPEHGIYGYIFGSCLTLTLWIYYNVHASPLFLSCPMHAGAALSRKDSIYDLFANAPGTYVLSPVLSFCVSPTSLPAVSITFKGSKPRRFW